MGVGYLQLKKEKNTIRTYIGDSEWGLRGVRIRDADNRPLDLPPVICDYFSVGIIGVWSAEDNHNALIDSLIRSRIGYGRQVDPGNTNEAGIRWFQATHIGYG